MTKPMSAEDAAYWKSKDWNPWERRAISLVRKMDAIASGRVVCHDTQAGVFVPFMSEDEADDKADAAWHKGCAAPLSTNYAEGYLAALRDLGVVKP